MARVSLPQFADYWQRTRAQLDSELPRWLPRFFPHLPQWQSGFVEEALGGGKRLRGCLVCLLCEALGGAREDAIPRALAVECVHAASLIHDDLVDGDGLRRGRPAFWTVSGGRKAVLLGDVIFATALQRMVELSPADGAALAQAIATMASGAYQEPLDLSDLQPALFDDERRGRELYPMIVYLKTGALFGAAARLGANAARSTPELADVAFEFGVQLGEAYQVADDLYDLVDAAEPVQPALLAPLLLYFCPDIDVDAPFDRLLEGQQDAFMDWLNWVRPQLRERMRADLALRLENVRHTAHSLPSGPYAPLLSAAPVEIVRALSAA